MTVRARRAAAATGAALFLAVAGAQPAAAHGLGGRADLPLPLWLVTYGTAGALLASFVALGVLWPRPRLEGGIAGAVLPRPFQLALTVARPLVRALGLLLFAVVLYAAAFGDTDPSQNIAPRAVYVVFWVGLTLVSGLVGDLWAWLSPYETLAGLAARLRRRPAGPEEEADRRRPYRLGQWPAVAGLAGFAWLELAHPDPASPRVIAVALALYSVAVLAGAAWWGREWLRQGEAFGVFFGVLTAMAPLYTDDQGRLRLRPPLAGLAGLAATPATTALVLVALGSTTFDGFTRTSTWADVVGVRTGWTAAVVTTVGLAFAVGVVGLLYVGAMRWSASIASREEPMDLVGTFMHSLVPIALAYAVAHYFSLLVFEGQGAWAQASDPFGRDWDLFRTAYRPIDYLAVSTSTIAFVQAGSILVGHVAGVVLAHDRAVALFRPRVATRSQYPLLAAMVAYTVGGLLLLLGG